MLGLVKKRANWPIFIICIILWHPVSAEILIKRTINPVSFFINRDIEIKSLVEDLRKYKTVSIVGVTSIGKTETLRRYASVHGDKYELIWFFDASIDLNEQFILLAKDINQSFFINDKDKLSENANESKKEVLVFLTTRDKWLLIFDNLHINENYKIEDIANWQHNGHIIISSQDGKSLPHVTYLHRLNNDHALSLAQNIINTKVNGAYLEKIVDIFRGYPGQIVQGATLIREHNYLSLEEYKSLLMRADEPIIAHMQIIKTLLSKEENKLLLQLALINNQYFSKEILKLLLNDSDKIGSRLFNLNRFGLIKITEKMNENTIFEMHDLVRDAVLHINQGRSSLDAINDIIDKLNQLMPKGVGSRYFLMNSDPTLKSNIEIILINAEKYNVDIHKILGLRQHLGTYYMAILDHYNWQKMKEWLEEKEAIGAINLHKMDEQKKVNYSWYMLTIGVYEDFVKSNYIKALACFEKAEHAIEDIEEQPELKTTILFQTAQTQVFGGDIINAEKNMLAADLIIKQHKNADYDMGLYWFIKAKISLAKGEYKDALLAVEENIKAEAHLPQDTFTAPTYILQSEILNFLGKYKESHNISQKIYSQEVGVNKPKHEIHARILTQLAKAELELEEMDSAFEHITTACNIFKKEIEQYKIQPIINVDLAASLVVLGDFYSQKKDFDKALEIYNEAEAIYHNRYGSNYGYTDDISYLLAQGTKAACLNKNTFWQKHYQSQLIKYFGDLNFRSAEALSACKESPL